MTRNLAIRPAVDWSLYLVTDRALSLGRPIEEIVLAAVAGGVTAVQLREKNCSTREIVALARALMQLLTPRGVPLLINDRVDVALAAGADGVHIGQSDMAYRDARALLGARALIGLSVETAEQACEAQLYDCDYLGVGPIFPTTTKSDAAPAWGLDRLAELRKSSRHPLVAIGGIGASNVAMVTAAGADGIAVVSAICSASDPRAAAAQLRMVIEETRVRNSR
jgi:thiamine-phosphate pyrophosphorylase